MSKFKEYLKGKLAPSNVDRVQLNINRYLQWCLDENVLAHHATPNDILAYLEHLHDRGLALKTRHIYLKELKYYYNYLQADPNPTIDIKLQQAQRELPNGLLEIEELEKLYDSYPVNTPVEIKNKTMLSLIIMQGLGTRDLKGLRVSDVKLNVAIIEVKATRRSNARKLELTGAQIMLLHNYIHNVRPVFNVHGSEQLLLNSTGSENIGSGQAKLFKKLGVRLAVLRASVIVNWLKSHSLRKVQYMAGHRYVSSTERYQKVDLTDLKKELEKYYPL